MIEYAVVVQPAARDDLEDIGDYLVAEAGVAAALRTLTAINDRIVALGSLPYRSQAVEFIEPGYRRTIVGAYAAYFVIDGLNVSVDRVLHTRRDISEALAPETRA